MPKSPNWLADVSTDYEDRPEHRGHTVEIQEWNDEYVLLLIRSDTKTNEAIVSTKQLRDLVDAADKKRLRWSGVDPS